MDGNLTGTTTQSGPGSNDNERVTPHSSELEPHCQMQFSAIVRTLHFGGFEGSNPPAGNSKCILRPAGRVVW